MDTKDLRFFRQVYETGSINKAARQLFITPQGLSRAIHRLEQEMDTALFERSSNGMISTRSGRYLYENCIPLLEQFDKIAVGVKQASFQNKTLKIGFSCGVLNVFPFQKLEEYKKNMHNSCCSGKKILTKRLYRRYIRESWILDLS